jgi:hypothetical protein
MQPRGLNLLLPNMKVRQLQWNGAKHSRKRVAKISKNLNNSQMRLFTTVMLSTHESRKEIRPKNES